MTRNCDVCKWYWNSLYYWKSCHQPDAMDVIKEEDEDCPWFEHKDERSKKRPKEFTDDDYDPYSDDDPDLWT